MITEDFSSENKICSLCLCNLTLGTDCNIKNNNLNIHVNGRKHKFLSLFIQNQDKVEGEDACKYKLKNNIMLEENNNFEFLNFKGSKKSKIIYCNLCNCRLPYCSVDSRLNIYNIKLHSLGNRHCSYVVLDHSRFKNNGSNLSVSKIESSVSSTFSLFDNIQSSICYSVKEIFKFIPAHLQHNENMFCYFKNRHKYSCNVCKCFISLSSTNKNIIVKNITCHVEGKKHIRLSIKRKENFIFTYGDIGNYWESFIRIINNKIINKSRIYICKISKNNIGCKVCECVLPISSNPEKLSANICNFEKHFLGKKHLKNIMNSYEKKIERQIKNEFIGFKKSSLLIIKIFSLLPLNVQQDMSSIVVNDQSNLICKICINTIIYSNINDSSDINEISKSVLTHVCGQKHTKNMQSKYIDIMNKLKQIKNEERKNIFYKLSFSNFCDYDFAINVYGEIQCNLCDTVVLSEKCSQANRLESHLNGKRHKNKKTIIDKFSYLRNLSKNIIIDIMDSLPQNYHINKEYLTLIHQYGIVNCCLCKYVFCVHNDYRLRNNLLLHIKSAKHNKSLNNLNLDFVDKSNIKSNNNNFSRMNKYNDSQQKLFCGNNEIIKQQACNNVGSKSEDLKESNGNDHLFKNIDTNYQLNCSYICLKDNIVFCNLCNCELNISQNIGVDNLIKHLKDFRHSQAMKSNEEVKQRPQLSKETGDLAKENYLQNVVGNFRGGYNIVNRNKNECNSINQISSIAKVIPASEIGNRESVMYDKCIQFNLRFNCECLEIKKNKFYCNICHTYLSDSTSLDATEKKVIDHFYRDQHKRNKNSKIICEKTFEQTNGDFGPSNTNEVLESIFIKHIPSNLQICRKYVQLKDNKLYCKICNSFTFICDISNVSAKLLTDHFNGAFHKKKYKQCETVSEVTQTSTAKTNKSADLLSFDEFLENMFSKYISTNLQLYKGCIWKQKNQLFCKICSCSISISHSPELTAKNLSSHLNGTIHKKNYKAWWNTVPNENSAFVAKSNESMTSLVGIDFLEDIFLKYIPFNLHLYRECIQIQEKQLYCKICDCYLCISKSSELSAKSLSEHLLGSVHKKNYKEWKTVSKENSASIVKSIDSITSLGSNEFLEDIFRKYISSSLQLYKEYIIMRKNKFCCIICDCYLSMSNSSELSAKSLSEHLLGSDHKNNYKERKTVSKENSVYVVKSNDFVTINTWSRVV